MENQQKSRKKCDGGKAEGGYVCMCVVSAVVTSLLFPS